MLCDSLTEEKASYEREVATILEDCSHSELQIITGTMRALKENLRKVRQELNPILQQSLSEKVGANSLRDLHDKGYLVSMDIYPSKEFILNDETIDFIYNPSEIVSYDKGETLLTIPLSILDNILKPEFKQ